MAVQMGSANWHRRPLSRRGRLVISFSLQGVKLYSFFLRDIPFRARFAAFRRFVLLCAAKIERIFVIGLPLATIPRSRYFLPPGLLPAELGF